MRNGAGVRALGRGSAIVAAAPMAGSYRCTVTASDRAGSAAQQSATHTVDVMNDLDQPPPITHHPATQQIGKAMTTQQPPTDNWQFAQAAGHRRSQAAIRSRARRTRSPARQFPPAGYVPVPAAKPKGRKRALIVAAIVDRRRHRRDCRRATALSAKPKGSVALPGTLLGPAEGQHARAPGTSRPRCGRRRRPAYGSKLAGVVAGVYGRNTGPWFAISGGGICGTCSPKSASVITNHLVADGYADAASFPAGPKGGDLACGSAASQSGTLIRCTWVDDTTAGDVLYANGSASGLADAAAKTNQARAAVER